MELECYERADPNPRSHCEAPLDGVLVQKHRLMSCTDYSSTVMVPFLSSYSRCIGICALIIDGLLRALRVIQAYRHRTLALQQSADSMKAAIASMEHHWDPQRERSANLLTEANTMEAGAAQANRLSSSVNSGSTTGTGGTASPAAASDGQRCPPGDAHLDDIDEGPIHSAASDQGPPSLPSEGDGQAQGKESHYLSLTKRPDDTETTGKSGGDRRVLQGKGGQEWRGHVRRVWTDVPQVRENLSRPEFVFGECCCCLQQGAALAVSSCSIS